MANGKINIAATTRSERSCVGSRLIALPASIPNRRETRKAANAETPAKTLKSRSTVCAPCHHCRYNRLDTLGSPSRSIGGITDEPTVSINANGKQHRTLNIVGLCLGIAAMSICLVDLSARYHRVVPTCSSAVITCYFANCLRPHRAWPIVAVVLAIVEISAFIIGGK
jgi:hypothetical protein